MTKRILLFGGHSQTGRALQALPPPADWQIFFATRADCDFTQPGDIPKIMRRLEPDLVINAAALTDIDACERDKDLALTVNFDAVAQIAAVCSTLDAPLIQLSTDYVFDGADDGKPYQPDDLMNPLNIYGHSKMLGEDATRHGLHWHVILRTSLVFSEFGDNVLTKTLRQIDNGEPVTAVTDQIACPTSAASLARALVMITEALLAGKSGGFGVFHFCQAPAVNRIDFAQAIIDAYAPFCANSPALRAVTSGDLPDRVPRPAYSALDCNKTTSVYGIEPTSWRDDLAQAVQDYRTVK